MPTEPDANAAGRTEEGALTAGADYADRLQTLGDKKWKQVLDVQRPYRWNLRRLELGRTLDVGCGIGRNLRNLGPDSVGVDHNKEAVQMARAGGSTAYDTDEFWGTDLGAPHAFDSMLMAHVLEHVSVEVGDGIIQQYLPCVRPGGKVVFITPQEVGFRSDATHIRWVDLEVSAATAERAGLKVEKAYSFPFPRPAGKVFMYNEFVVVARVPA